MARNSVTPCGRKACRAAARIVLPISGSQQHASRLSGVNRQVIASMMLEEGLKMPPHKHSPKRIPEAAIRRAQADGSRNIHEVSASLGICASTLWRRASRLGLPPRAMGVLNRKVVWPEDFDEMWLAGVSTTDIVRSCPVPPKSRTSVHGEVKRRGLPLRVSGRQKDSQPLLQYLLKKDAKQVHAATRAIWYGAAA